MTKQPKPVTGRARPDPTDLDALLRMEEAERRFKQIWVEYPPQRLILQHLRLYLRQTKERRGVPLSGRRLSQDSQAGKSSTMDRLKYELAQEDIAAGREPNPYNIVHITIDKRMTLKQFYQEILNKLDDEFAAYSGEGALLRAGHNGERKRVSSRDSVKVLEQRIAEWVLRLGVELIVVDEVQRLSRTADDADEVTEKLQAFLDRGVVPLVLVGDDTSKAFFERNPQFAARLLMPLELRPMDENRSADLKLFKEFCTEFDRQLVVAGATAVPSGLDKDDVLDALLEVSGGHVGRVARLLEVALPAAIGRGAVCIEPYDLSNVTRSYAMPMGWAMRDPFSLRAA